MAKERSTPPPRPTPPPIPTPPLRPASTPRHDPLERPSNPDIEKGEGGGGRPRR